MDALGGAAVLLVPIIILLSIIYILLPFKLWRMADRIKKIGEESKKQTEVLEKIARSVSEKPVKE